MTAFLQGASSESPKALWIFASWDNKQVIEAKIREFLPNNLVCLQLCVNDEDAPIITHPFKTIKDKALTAAFMIEHQVDKLPCLLLFDGSIFNAIPTPFTSAPVPNPDNFFQSGIDAYNNFELVEALNW